jgi:hypothetical protein
MNICVLFHFHDQEEPSVSTGVEGNVTDLLLPSVGDIVRHRDTAGNMVLGRVSERTFRYDVCDGFDVNGSVVVTLTLNKLQVH